MNLFLKAFCIYCRKQLNFLFWSKSHDTFWPGNEIKKEAASFLCQFKHLKGAGINVQDLFLNADTGFDSQELKDICFRLDLFPNIDLNKRRGKKSNGR